MTERMTATEFDEKSSELLARLPIEVRAAVSWMAYDRGHAYGHEEILCHIQEYVGNLEQPLILLINRIKYENN